MEDELQELSRRFPAGAEYLIQIHFIEREGDAVVGARIARRLGVSSAAVTQALGRLVRRGLLEQGPTHGFRLTESGRNLARRILRRHYLLERLLVDELGFDWDAADEEAARLQHALSRRMEEFLYERLGRPSTCPHGNPFPGAPEEDFYLSAPTMSEAAVGQRAEVLRITEEGELEQGLLAFCARHGLIPGTAITVLRRDDRQVLLESGGRQVAVPEAFSRHIRIRMP